MLFRSHDVITRRLKHHLDPPEPTEDEETGRFKRFAYPPSLILVDGGPPQVAAAQRAFDELGITDIALAGIAKRLEEIWLPGEEYPVILPRTSEALFLVQRLRDEAHRFAITTHRAKRAREMAVKYIGGYYRTVLDHYQFGAAHMKNQRGYEYYAKMNEKLAAPLSLARQNSASRFPLRRASDPSKG